MGQTVMVISPANQPIESLGLCLSRFGSTAIYREQPPLEVQVVGENNAWYVRILVHGHKGSLIADYTDDASLTWELRDLLCEAHFYEIEYDDYNAARRVIAAVSLLFRDSWVDLSNEGVIPMVEFIEKLRDPNYDWRMNSVP
jgi:hypothetical protein